MPNTEPAKPIIPTAFKEKLPKGFTYPLGAMEISSALIDIPQFGNARLWFRWRDEFWASEWRKRLNSGGVFKLFDFYFFKYYSEWRIGIYSVPSPHSVLAREYLRKELIRVRAEILAARSDATATKSSVMFDLSWAKADLARRSVAGKQSLLD